MIQQSILDIVYEIKVKLLEFPAIVTSLEKKDPQFITNLIIWIKNTEDILIKYNISEVSELAGFRSRILSPKFSDSRRISVKKAQVKIASELLYDIQHTVLKILKPYEIKIDECRELIRQLLSIVNQTEKITYDNTIEFQNFIETIWNVFINHNQLKPGTVKLKTLISKTDILRIIAEEIDLSEWNQKHHKNLNKN